MKKSTLFLSLAALLLVAVPAQADLQVRLKTGTLNFAGSGGSFTMSVNGDTCSLSFTPPAAGASAVYDPSCPIGTTFESLTLTSQTTNGWYAEVVEVDDGQGWVRLAAVHNGELHESIWLDKEPFNSSSAYSGEPFTSAAVFTDVFPITLRFTTGTTTFAPSSGPIRLKVNGGTCIADFTPAGSGGTKTHVPTCPVNTSFSSVTLEALTLDGWLIRKVELDVGQGWTTLSPELVWVDKAPFDPLSRYAGFPFATTQTFQ